MERTVHHVVDGELREQIQYYHRISVVTVVSSAFPIPLGIRFQKNGETEVACSLALLKELREQLGRRFLDLLVADALYLQAPFIAAVETLGLDWVINLKENQPELLAEARRILLGEGSANPQELQLWHPLLFSSHPPPALLQPSRLSLSSRNSETARLTAQFHWNQPINYSLHISLRNRWGCKGRALWEVKGLLE